MLLALASQAYASSRGGKPSPPPTKKPVLDVPKRVPVPLSRNSWVIAKTTDDDFNEPGFPKSGPVPERLRGKDYVKSITCYVPVRVKLPQKSSEMYKYDAAKLQFDHLEINVSFEGSNWIIRLDAEEQIVGCGLRVQLILAETREKALNVTMEVQLKVLAAPYTLGQAEACMISTHPIIISENFVPITNPSSASAPLSGMHYPYHKEHVLTYQHAYLVFRMFRIFDKGTPSSSSGSGSLLPLPSAPKPSQREQFGLVGMYNFKAHHAS